MADIVKNGREIIRVTRDDFKGHDMVNVRVFFDAGDGEMKPGKQGVAFRAALLPDVLNALSQCAEVEAQ
ncbi:transcriptional coactivator p15/PC4 family protein [Sulfitobacter sp. 20_GPM-1509m]|uniref:transcriptional coactivator p15/PC4 family protein n=1 Tax=Sulfitobacter sp. 20_GPM-1509m TaxID=1380367 RepID=UPI00055D2A59|nr:transcriptional coactivator p15/PC4 family protein [Sulfitobacter sp. 20_GPM-1509m]